jgi:hypothetical protein
MKSQTISHTRGFLISEIMLAFSILTLLLTSAVVLSVTTDELKKSAEQKLENLESTYSDISNDRNFSESLYGNDTTQKYFEPITETNSDYGNAWGRETCSPRLPFSASRVSLRSQFVNLGAANASTDLEVRHGIAYVSADSSAASLPDFYIIDTASSTILSALNTGPGLSALEIAGPYAYLANLSTTQQLQVVDISNRMAPILVSKFKLPLPQASSTPTRATAIFYRKGLIYLGTEKWEGNEFSIIDVHIPSNPVYLGGFKTNTLINYIYVRGDQAFIAASDAGQMRILNISDPSNIIEISQFSPSGWETQQGKILSYFENQLLLGRTTGGFNVAKNHEIFAFSTTSMLASRDIPGGVYGIIDEPDMTFLATHSSGHEFQIWNKNFDQLQFEKSLGFAPQALTCDDSTLFFATGDQWGISEMKIN